MKPFYHAESSAKKYGGVPEDYLEIHDWFDQTKSNMPDVRHRAILHSSFGIFLAEQVFGTYITNSAGKKVMVRDIGEQHVMEDLNFIPTMQDWLTDLPIKDWMISKTQKDAPKKRTVIKLGEKEDEPEQKVIRPVKDTPIVPRIPETTPFPPDHYPAGVNPWINPPQQPYRVYPDLDPYRLNNPNNYITTIRD